MNMQLQVLPDNDTSVIRGPVIKKTGWPRGQWSGANPTPECFPFSGVPGANYELYKQYGCERYVEMLHIINEAWKGNVDSYLAGVIRGVARFISVYEGEYSRERLVQQLARTHPKTITQLALNVLSGNRSE